MDSRNENILNLHKESFENVPSIKIFLHDITEKDYYETLLVLFDSDFQIYLKQKPNASFINYQEFR